MTTKTATKTKKQVSHSILAYSSGAMQAFRFFTKEDFLQMMFDMSIEDIEKDLERFKNLEEYGICNKLKFVLQEKKRIDNFCLATLRMG